MTKLGRQFIFIVGQFALYPALDETPGLKILYPYLSLDEFNVSVNMIIGQNSIQFYDENANI